MKDFGLTAVIVVVAALCCGSVMSNTCTMNEVTPATFDNIASVYPDDGGFCGRNQWLQTVSTTNFQDCLDACKSRTDCKFTMAPSAMTYCFLLNTICTGHGLHWGPEYAAAKECPVEPPNCHMEEVTPATFDTVRSQYPEYDGVSCLGGQWLENVRTDDFQDCIDACNEWDDCKFTMGQGLGMCYLFRTICTEYAPDWYPTEIAVKECLVDCTPPFEYVSGRCLRLVHTRLKYEDAIENCKDVEGVPGRIYTAKDEEHYAKLCNWAQLTDKPKYYKIWVGLSNIDGENNEDFRWDDDDDTSLDDTWDNWAIHQPRNKNLMCAATDMYSEYKWRTYRCNGKRVHSICEQV